MSRSVRHRHAPRARTASAGSSCAGLRGHRKTRRRSISGVERWDRRCMCRGPSRRPVRPPPLEDVVVLTWNAHLAEGRLTELIRALRTGELTNGVPVRHFVLLLQELYRRGPDVPAFSPGMRSAHAIRARDEAAPDVHDYAATLGLSLLYVPSMRNGSDLDEDRGNAIISTEPLSNAVAFELPFARQRRVAVGATIAVTRGAARSSLRLVERPSRAVELAAMALGASQSAGPSGPFDSVLLGRVAIRRRRRLGGYRAWGRLQHHSEW